MEQATQLSLWQPQTGRPAGMSLPAGRRMSPIRYPLQQQCHESSSSEAPNDMPAHNPNPLTLKLNPGVQLPGVVKQLACVSIRRMLYALLSSSEEIMWQALRVWGKPSHSASLLIRPMIWQTAWAKCALANCALEAWEAMHADPQPLVLMD